MTLNEIVYNIKNLAEGGYTTDDNKLSTRQIKAWVNYHRLNILESYTNNGKNIPQGATQNIGTFVVPDEGEYLTLPKVASYGDTRGITSITSVDGNMIFARTTQDKISYQEQSRFTSSMPKFFLEEGVRLYFYGSGGGEQVKIVGVLEDPTSASSWSGDDDQYPLPSQLVNPLIKMVAEVEMNLTVRTPGDIINDELEADSGIQRKVRG
tara:strand:+ start:4057 stop:4683 length:627 start_codon:yes stop_codon:yes gene_type:complete